MSQPDDTDQARYLWDKDNVTVEEPLIEVKGSDHMANTKTENGAAYEQADFAYTPDDIPSRWELRIPSTLTARSR